MDPIRSLLRPPNRARFIPYALFVVPIALAGKFGPDSYFWVYFGRTLLGAALIWIMWPLVTEMRFAFSWEAVLIGIAVFVMWVGIDSWYPGLYVILHKTGLGFLTSGEDGTPHWNPFARYGSASLLGWFFAVARIMGSSLVVPPLEEAFFRSYLYRWVAKPEFTDLPLNYFGWKPFLVTAVLFGLIHNQWLAGILCAFAYQGLVLRRNRLGDAMTAHGITNCLLGIYVVWKGAWQFW